MKVQRLRTDRVGQRTSDADEPERGRYGERVVHRSSQL